MKKWIALLLVAVLALGAYVVAGPYLAINGIQKALAEQDTRRLERHVDFPSVRASLKAQLEDRMARRAGSQMQQTLFGSLALGVARSVMGGGVDAMVTPMGIAAILQGRTMWKQSMGQTVDGGTFSRAVPVEPLSNATHRYESPSRFVATVEDPQGEVTVFVFRRQGLVWKLTDIRLPL